MIELTISDILNRARRNWLWILIALTVSIVAPILFLRTVPPKYEARASIIERSDSRQSGLLGSYGRLLSTGIAASTSIDQFRAVLYSADFAALLAEDQTFLDMAGLIETPPETFTAKLRIALRDLVNGTILGRDTPGPLPAAELVRNRIRSALTIERSRDLATLVYTSSNRESAKFILSAIIEQGNEIMRLREIRSIEAEIETLKRIDESSINLFERDTLRERIQMAVGSLIAAQSRQYHAFTLIDGVNSSSRPIYPSTVLYVLASVAVVGAAILLILIVLPDAPGSRRSAYLQD